MFVNVIQCTKRSCESVGAMISIIFNKQFTNKVEMILHSPCNIPNKMFEMTVVLDCSLSKEAAKEIVPHLLKTLKMHSEVFANVRLNMVRWEDDEAIRNQVMPMSMAMLSSYYEDYAQKQVTKDYQKLMQNLKLFHARSKLIIIVTDGKYETGDTQTLKKIMQPFLYRKVMNVIVGDTIELR